MFCQSCGAENADIASFCTKCGAQLGSGAGAYAPTPPDPILKWILPVGRSGWAVAAGYLALLFPVVAVFIFLLADKIGAPGLAVLAPTLPLIFGLLALSDIKKHPQKAGRGRAWFGIVVGGASTILGVVLILANLAD